MPASWAEDGSIPDDCRIWRAIPEQFLYPVDPITGDQDFSDSVFRSQEVSVYAVAETTPQALAAKFPGLRFREMTAGAARKFGLLVVRDSDDVGDTSHAVIGRRDLPGNRLTGSQAANLKKVSKWADAGPGQFLPNAAPPAIPPPA
jgi:hypothetical protein